MAVIFAGRRKRALNNNKNKLSAGEIRRHNKRRIYRALLDTSTATKQEISERTELSIPKVTQVLSELIDEGLVYIQGIQASSGGRRPELFCAKNDARLAAGIGITRSHLDFSVLNLNGETVVNERIRFSVKMDETFYSSIHGRFLEFLNANSVPCDKLIGVGIAIPGIISKDNDCLSYSHVMRTDKPFDLRPLRRLFSVPVTFFNDADAACTAECYTGRAPSAFNFLSLTETVGGATVIDGHIVSGCNGRAGEAGHLQIVPNGRPCYCGKQGHYDAYGSSAVLSGAAGGSLADFFAALERGDSLCTQVFEEYIYYLALIVTNLLLWSDLPVLIGGYVSGYLSPYVEKIKAKISEMSIFKQEEEYLYLSSYHYEASSVGGARYYIEHFMETL